MRQLALGLATAMAAFVALYLVITSSLPKPPTPQELRAIPASELRYPNAVEVGRHDKLGSYSLFGEAPTVAETVYMTGDSSDAVERWYHAELSSRGWVREADLLTASQGVPPFHRWCQPGVDADFWLIINNQGTETRRYPPDQFGVSIRSHSRPEECRAGGGSRDR